MADMDNVCVEYARVAAECEPMLRRLISELQEITVGLEYIDRVSGRVKSKRSFLRKVATDPRKYDPPFAQVEDFLAIRILTVFPDAAHRVAAFVKSQFYPGVEDEYRQPEDPSQFGYEGYQLIKSLPWPKTSVLTVWDRPKVFEIQVKTLFMHAWAEAEHLLRYEKVRVGQPVPTDVERKLAWMAASAWGSDEIMSELLRRHENGH
jgi:ppGpp synthetase/RelA/SpoT-type nucleotidyltranferase